MKKIMPLFLAILLAGPALAQDVEELKKRKAEKLAGEWLQKSPWITDFDKAMDTAEAKSQIIFAYFTRSYRP